MTALPDRPIDVHDGFLPLIADHRNGRLIVGVRDRETRLFITGGLVTGVGASALRLDRGFPGSIRTAVLNLAGGAISIEFLSRDFGAGAPDDNDPVARAAVDDAFARSVVFRGPVLGTDDLTALSKDAGGNIPDALAYVDITAFVASDVHGFAAAFAAPPGPTSAPAPGATRYGVVDKLSSAETTTSYASALSTELTGVLTFAPRGLPPQAAIEVSPDPLLTTVSQRISLRPIPSGFRPSQYHPRSGGYGKGYDDATLTGRASIRRTLQPRFRIEAHRPIVFSVDPAIPAPYRDAVVEGGNWWSTAFASAGLRDAYRVEVRDRATDPWAPDVNPVWWVHRSGRGWSMGHAVTDPFTGEILRGSVRLGSQRVTQLRTLFEALLSPFGRPDEAERLAEIEAAIVQRIRHLAAHEIGHALGFVHNYASTHHSAPSVMDYPHPRIGIRPDGELTLRGAYSDGVGPWDIALVRHAYSSDSQNSAAVRSEVTDLPFVSDNDGHAPSASVTLGVPWTVPLNAETPDVFAALDQILAVRAKALADFGASSAGPGSETGELLTRYTAIHLLHRFQVQAVARILGGADYPYGLLGDAPAEVTAPPAAKQWAALDTLASLLDDATTVPHPRLTGLLRPPSLRHPRSSDAFPTRLGPVFDSDAAHRAAVAIVANELLSAERLNRIASQAAETSGENPTVDDVVRTAFHRVRGATSSTRHSLVRHVLAALNSAQIIDDVDAALRIALHRAAAEHDDLTEFIRSGLAHVEADTLSSSRRYALPVVSMGVPL